MNATVDDGPSLRQRFEQLDRFLAQHQALWRPRPFTELQLPWEREHPQLAAWLRSRSLEDAEAAHNQPALLEAPEPFASLAAQALALSQIASLPLRPPPVADSRQNAGVPGRKWQQILAFGSALDFHQHAEQWLDWCAGKGHLGRLLARDGQPVTCLEWDAQLVSDGARISQRLGLPVSHRQQDVMQPGAAIELAAGAGAVALHACGDLHVELLRQGSAARCRHLAIAPCCYNRTRNEHYQPLSMPGQQAALRLGRDDLGLPLSETVTAGNREKRQRDQSMAWRLAFDLLQRELRQSDSYLPTPSLPSAWLKKSLRDYCHDLAALKNLQPPPEQDWPALERRGWQRLAQVRNLELLRGLFRRPLELWLVLDRALLLEENGYRVRVGTFCDAELTPRNLLLLAELEE